MQKIVKLLIIAVPFLMSHATFGAGFALYEFSARGVAMGGSVMANTAEPASLASNPALITELEGTQIQLGTTVVLPQAETTFGGQSRELKSKSFILPNLYVTQQMSDDVFVGLGIFSRFGLGGEYKSPLNWPGSRLAYKVGVETVSFAPSLAVKMCDDVAISMGLEAMVIGFSENVIGYEVSGSGTSWGGNFALLYRPDWAEKWSAGVTYRSKIKQTLNGRIKSPLAALAGDVRGSIALPDSIAFGLAFKPTDDLILEAGITGTFWSSYDQIMIEYKNDDPARAPIIDKKNYRDVYRLNFGVEYKLNPAWAVRAGYVFDKSPINVHAMDTLVPADDRHIVSGGVGYEKDRYGIDVAYAHLFMSSLNGITNKRNGHKPIHYANGNTDMLSVSFRYKF